MRGSRWMLTGGALDGASKTLSSKILSSKILSSLTLSFLVLSSGGAAADCLRHVYNRSPLVLVATQDGGPSFVVRPGSSRTIRLSGPGKLDLAGYCAPLGRGDDLASLGAPAVQSSFGYQAVLDRCFFEFGHDFFDRELGRGFLPYDGTQPFTLNNPKQGDIVLTTDQATCLPRR
ncbi:hypothetical protein [Methylobacterium sp. J-068]|uniref:hypothetical protein n=1 Tax=Methylobacterium sp. J-068 TaxID=2836649 RepID=UPI001FB9268E|nr:hypothetical protein [Methylobacterium sp. J-068]MCJ2034010.1 hypothetical protein [Methylobacterium sp. J-068]